MLRFQKVASKCKLWVRSTRYSVFDYTISMRKFNGWMDVLNRLLYTQINRRSQLIDTNRNAELTIWY